MAKSPTVVEFTPALNTSAYSDNDVLFIATALPDVASEYGGYVKLVSAVCFDAADQGTEVEVFFTHDSTTPGTINEALSAADTVFDGIVGRAHFVTYADLINSQVCVLLAQDQIMKCPDNSRGLYVFGVVRSGTPTYAASSLVFKFAFERL